MPPDTLPAPETDDRTPNPLAAIHADPPFDLITAEHVEPALDALLADARARLDAVVAQPGPRTFDNTLVALEDATEALSFGMGLVGHLESSATTAALRAAYNAVQPRVSAFWSSIALDEGLWGALTAFARTDEARALVGTRKRLLEKTLDGFRRAGADLDPKGKARLKEIDVELATVTTRFSQNVLDSTQSFEIVVHDEARVAGLPESAREAARESAKSRGVDGWRFTLAAPSYVAAVTYLDDAALREQLWRAYNTRGTRGEHDNRPGIARTLELRREKARLVGYADFADFALADRMARNGARAKKFVDDLRATTEEAFRRENAQLEAFRREAGDAGPMRPWDVAYWAEKQRKARYDFDEEALRPYFETTRVRRGMFEIAERLFGVKAVPRAGVPVWDPAVESFDLADGDGRVLGRFYVDPFPRENKRDGAWMKSLFTAATDTRVGVGLPHVAVISGNLTPPTSDRPSLLTHRDVETLFHEFGHLLHHCLSRVEVRSLAGTNVAWDFVELPSQIMENWCWERAALDLFARHHVTGEPMPDALFERMLRARTYRAANAMMRQLGFAALDLALHVDFDPARDGDPTAFARRVLAPYMSAPLTDDYAMVASFGHLFASPTGYAAGYYSYKWAEVLDADAFTRFKSSGIFSPEVGRAFRAHVLERGDSEEPDALFQKFMGRPPRVESLLERSGLAPT